MKILSFEDRVVDTVAIILVLVFAICCAYPLVYCLSMSFSDDNAILTNSVTLLPDGFNIDSYKIVLGQQQFWTSLRNSIILVVLGTIWQVSCTFALGYVMSRKDFVFYNALSIYTLIPMFFGGGLIPTFLLIKNLGLYNSWAAIILPAGVSIWNAILAKSFIRNNIPNELIEAATIDGANDFQILFRLILPLSTTIIAILCLYAAVGFWNDYMDALIYLQDTSLQPLQLYLRNILLKSTALVDDPSIDPDAVIKTLVENSRIKYVLIVVSTLPIVIFYPFLQKYFVKGVMLGSVKG